MEKEANIKDRQDRNWGDLPLIQSDKVYNLQFTDFSHLEQLEDSTPITLRARIHTSRAKGNLCFFILRQQFYTVQAVAFKSDQTPKEMINYLGKISNESIVDITGTIKKVQKPIEGCSIKLLEINIQKCYVVSRSKNVLPFQMEDAMRNENIEEAEQKAPIVKLKTRLDNRVLDLRIPSNQAIFRIQAGICHFYRDYLMSQNFIEIHTPKLIGGVSEGGSEVFKFDYFGKPGCLAQSPQLYKQMMIMGDFRRVFEIGHVFRAEKSFTHRHLCEFIGLDGEMEIKEHYNEVMEILGQLFNHIFKGLKQQYQKEIEAIKHQYGYEEFLFLEKPLILSFEEGVKLLKEANVEQSLHEDLSSQTEKTLGDIVREKYKTDFYILHRYPETARPFYTMLCKDDPSFTCSYDVFMRGQEIISGAQRIHEPEFLKTRAIAKGIDVNTLNDYIESFSYGAYPHGGFGIGLERVTFLYLGLYDVKKASLFPRDPSRLTP